MKRDGRPQIYSDKDLLKKLQEFQNAHPGQKIKMADLERETGIPVHVWKYRMRAYIQELNQQETESKIPKEKNLILPSAHDMYISCADNPQMIEENFDMLLNIIHTLQTYKNVESTISDLKNEYERKIYQLELENEEKEKSISQLNLIVNKYILDSASLEKRSEQGIQCNIIQFNRDNMEQFQNMFNELLK